MFFILLVLGMFCLSKDNVPKEHPFTYNLGIRFIPNANPTNSLTVCCHGYGHNNKIIDIVHATHALQSNLVSFNFPDYNITDTKNHNLCAYGSIQEILPLLYVLRYYVCDLKLDAINIYGFSAGGGAIINMLMVLNTSLYQEHLSSIGIHTKEIKQILSALERGYIILDCPLKSISEILAHRGKSPFLQILDNKFTKNNFNPIDSLNSLTGITLPIIVHFQNPDEILSNRDDALFIDRLQKANQGKTTVIIGSNGGHNSYHPPLWDYCKKLKL